MIHSREIIRWYRTTHCKSTWVQHHSASPGPASSKHFTSTAARTLQHLVVQVRGRSGESTPRCPQGLERDEPSCLAPPSSVHFSGVSPSSDQVDPFSLHVRIARKPIGSEPSILGYPPPPLRRVDKSTTSMQPILWRPRMLPIFRGPSCMLQFCYTHGSIFHVRAGPCRYLVLILDSRTHSSWSHSPIRKLKRQGCEACSRKTIRACSRTYGGRV